MACRKEGAVDAEDALDGEGAGDDLVGIELWYAVGAFESGQHDGASAPRHTHGVDDRLRGVGGDIKHDIGAAPRWWR